MITPQSWDAVEAEHKAARVASGNLTEMERVLAIPLREVMIDDEAAIHIAGYWTETLRRHDDAPGLRPGQGLVLDDLYNAAAPVGVVGGLTVGGGKTLISMLAPEVIALATGTRPRTVVLVPAPLRKQWGRMCTQWSEHYKFTVQDAVSHGALSRPEGTDLLETLQPELIIIDECQAFRHLTSARTRRLIRYAVEHPTCRFVLLSGSLAADSIRDFAHLLELALRVGSVCPLSERELEKWCAVLDYRGEPQAADWRSIWPLVRKFSIACDDPGPLKLRSGRIAYSDRKSLAQRAFGRRLRTAPGVVLSTGGSCGASIRCAMYYPTDLDLSLTTPPSMASALRGLSNDWVLPDGELLVDALEVHRHSGTLAVGYYNRMVWEGGKNEEWIEARRGWAAAVRNTLEYYSRPGFDSPALVEASVKAGFASSELIARYQRWVAVRDEANPYSETIWLDGAREWLQRCVAVKLWQVKDSRTLVWWQSRPVAAALKDMGLEVFGAGSDQPPDSTDNPAVSIRVHREGANLQGGMGNERGWHRNLILEPAANPAWNQQLIGRTHRQGQRAGTIYADWFAATWPLRKTVEDTIARAHCLQNLTSEPQKMLQCDWVG